MIFSLCGKLSCNHDDTKSDVEELKKRLEQLELDFNEYKKSNTNNFIEIYNIIRTEIKDLRKDILTILQLLKN